MRKLLIGVLLPAVILAVAIYARAVDDGVHLYHPWQLRWDIWLASVIVTSMMVGVGLHMYWTEGGWRRDTRVERRRRKSFDHDAVQLDADVGNRQT